MLNSPTENKTFRLDRIVYCLRDTELKPIDQVSLKIKEWENYWSNTRQNKKYDNINNRVFR